MFNSGQACTSVERVYVEEPVYDAFVELVAERVRRLRQRAPGKGYDADVGALSSEVQLVIVEEHVSEHWPRAPAHSSAASEPPSLEQFSSRRCSWTSTSRCAACARKPLARRCP